MWWWVGCIDDPPAHAAPPPPPPVDPCARAPLSDGFGFPVGGGTAEGYYDAQPFGVNDHLGSDWNAVTGGATDYGHPVQAIGNGLVTDATEYGGGWGLVVRIVHRDGERCVESFYGHLAEARVTVGDVVARGEGIGTIGDANGRYVPHLHLELRTEPGRPLGPGCGEPKWRVDPTAFILARAP